ncbi:inositol monophosphatase family protein [Pseudonocardia acaciae]|uniref:inositol monophosphatase family protein n=1 Tax=Pseudonocardia acaciae TaxID=551276 RepID=UPI00048E2336|nr:inositol monophosphatase family protein [Pseudonocardia acaciae]
MDRSDPEALRAVATRLAGEAAEVAAGLRARAITQVRTKSTDTDVVTAADTETERLLRGRLAELRPGDAVLGEEAGMDGAASPAEGQLCWVIDPIDGTVNYLYGYPWYAVSVAVTRDGAALAGAVVEPASGRVWSAAAGGGASLDGEPLRASGAERLDLALIGTGFSYHRGRRVRQGELATGLLSRVRDIRRGGAASLDLCAVAAGWLDGYYEHGINPWDWAAGALVASEAGAAVHAPDPAAPFGDAIVVAAPGIDAQLTDALSELGAGGV